MFLFLVSDEFGSVLLLWKTMIIPAFSIGSISNKQTKGHYPVLGGIGMMKQHSYRSTWADVNLENVKKNVTTFIKRLNKPTQLMAVVKADGYGHGAVEIANVALE